MYPMYPSSEVKVENEMTVEREMTAGGEVDGRKVTRNPVQKFNKLRNTQSGAAKKVRRRISRLLDHCRQWPCAPYRDVSYWPGGLKDYVVRCYETCGNEQEKKLLQDLLKEKIWILRDDGLLMKTNWRHEPILELTR